MKSWKDALISPADSIHRAVEVIDQSALQVCLVVEEDRRLVGVVTDGDVRRGILQGIALERPVSETMFTRFTAVSADTPRETVRRLMREKQLRHIPVLDPQGRVVDLKLLSDMIEPEVKPNSVVLMAGGLGTRLRPLTQDCPKPMLKVGDKPILETIIENFVDQGFVHFYLAVNFKSHVIEDHFGDGSDYGAQITYLREEKRLGTAGALSLLPQRPQHPFLVMNGDLLTKINFSQLIDFHAEHQALGTMCVRQYDMQVPYGVVDVQDNTILGLQEKPVHSFFVNAGIYALDPQALDYIPHDRFYDMTDLFQTLVQNGSPTSAFPIREYWIDVGQMSDYERANGEFGRYFASEEG